MIHYRHDRARQIQPPAQIVLRPLKLIGIVEAALKASGVSPTRFGRDAARDPALVGDLRAGRQPRAKLRSAIVAHAELIGSGKAVRHA